MDVANSGRNYSTMVRSSYTYDDLKSIEGNYRNTIGSDGVKNKYYTYSRRYSVAPALAKSGMRNYYDYLRAKSSTRVRETKLD